jgi:NADH:ubiquinone oxidoreductase subunit 4 (subunit M)
MQRDTKKLVAYSSVTHITFIIVGLVSISKITLISVVLVSLAHG